MRNIFFWCLLLISLASYGQEPPYNQMKSNYQFRGVRIDSLFLIPKYSDTSLAQTIDGTIIRVQEKVYVRYGGKWNTPGVDTTSLSDRINDKIDSIKKIGDWVYFKKNGEWNYSYKDSVGSTDTISLSNRINSKADTSLLQGVLYFSDTLTYIATKSDLPPPIDTTSLSNRINQRVKYTDTSLMLQPYLRKSDTTSLSNRINLKLNIGDTSSMLSKYLRKSDTSSLSLRIDQRIKYTDSSSMLNPYLRKIDTASLSNRINNKIDSLYRNSTNVYYVKNGVSTLAYTDSIGSTDTSSLSQRIDQKADYNPTIGFLPYRDTSTFSNSYLKQDGDVLKSVYGGNDVGLKLDFGNNIYDFASSYGSNGIKVYSIYNGGGAKIDLGDINANYGNGTGLIIQDDITTIKSRYANNDIGLKLDFVNQQYKFGDNEQNLTIDGDSILLNGITQQNRATDSALVIDVTGRIGKAAKSTGGGYNGRFGNDTATIVMAKVHNDAGVQLTNGKVVYLSSSGTSSDVPSVKLGNNKGDSSSANTFGFVTGTIAINDTGWIILSGKIEKLNTASFSNGDIIYLDSISGQYTKSKPKAPYHLVYLGVVVKSNSGNGSIFVKPQNGYELDEIHDVQINSILNNQILVYSDTQKIWKNRSVYSVVDTTQLSARIDQRVKYSDTAALVAPYVHYTDTASMFTSYLRSNTASATYTPLTRTLTINGTAQDLSLNRTFNVGTITSITTNTGLSGGTITSSGTISADTTILSTRLWRQKGIDSVQANVNLKLNSSDSSTYQTKYRTDTMRTNVYNALNGKQGTLTLTTTGTSGAATLTGNTLNIPQYSGGSGVNGSGSANKIAYWTNGNTIADLSTATYPDLTELSYVKGTTSAIQTQLNSKQATLTNPVTGTGTSGSLTKFSGTSTVQNATVDVDYLQQDMSLVALQAMGSSIKGYNIGCPNVGAINLSQALTTQRLTFTAIYIPKSTTITGVRWFQTANGNFTANNYNGVALYSVSGGTLTLVASSTNDGNIWQQGTGWQSKAFSSTYAASAGIFYIAYIYSASSATTVPAIGHIGSQSATYNNTSNFDFTNNNRLGSILSSQTSLPSTQALSGLTSESNKWGVYLY